MWAVNHRLLFKTNQNPFLTLSTNLKLKHNGCDGYSPCDAVRAGVDSDGDVVYIGQAIHEGELLPAQVIPNKGLASVSFDGRAIELRDYEVLIGYDYEWLPGEYGKVPPNAIRVGRNIDGEQLFCGRGSHNGSMIVGKVHPSHECLYVPYDSEEIGILKYEVLCQKMIELREDQNEETQTTYNCCTIN